MANAGGALGKLQGAHRGAEGQEPSKKGRNGTGGCCFTAEPFDVCGGSKQTLKRNGISRLAFWNRCTMHEMSGTAREASREAFSWGVRGRRSVDDMWQRRTAVHAVAST